VRPPPLPRAPARGAHPRPCAGFGGATGRASPPGDPADPACSIPAPPASPAVPPPAHRHRPGHHAPRPRPQPAEVHSTGTLCLIPSSSLVSVPSLHPPLLALPASAPTSASVLYLGPRDGAAELFVARCRCPLCFLCILRVEVCVRVTPPPLLCAVGRCIVLSPECQCNVHDEDLSIRMYNPVNASKIE
jgi:hypothetical protein